MYILYFWSFWEQGTTLEWKKNRYLLQFAKTRINLFLPKHMQKKDEIANFTVSIHSIVQANHPIDNQLLHQ